MSSAPPTESQSTSNALPIKSDSQAIKSESVSATPNSSTRPPNQRLSAPGNQSMSAIQPPSATHNQSILQAYLSTLPEFHSTPRIQSLYSDLGRQKLSNPSGYATNLSWWRNMVREVVKRGLLISNNDIENPAGGDGDVLVLKVDQGLTEAFRWEKVGRPAGLGTVIDDLVQDNTLYPISQFLSSTISIYESTSVVGRVADLLIKRSLWWALGQLNLVQNRDDESPAVRWRRVCGNYVVVPVLEKLADAIIAVQDEKSGLTLSETLYTVESFKKFAEACLSKDTVFGHHRRLSETDVKVLLKYLSRDRRVLVQGEVVKFAENENEREVTSVDRGVVDLKTTIERVEQQVEHIQSCITTRTAQIKAALLASRKEIAKLQLTSRHALSALLIQRLNTLSTLQAALNSIDQAHGDAAIVRAYETSNKVLKEVMGRPEMQRERVDEVMEQLREGMEGAEEVRRAVEEGGWEVVESVGAGVDEEELKRELEELEKEERATMVDKRASEEEERRIVEVTRSLEKTEISEKVATPRSEGVLQVA